MKIIGINYLSESSVCLLINGSIINAISEERINRTKNWYGLPSKTIDFILKKNNLKAKNIDYVTNLSWVMKPELDKQKNMVYLQKKYQMNI